MVTALAAAAVVGIAVAGTASWNAVLLATLFAFALVSDLWAIDTRANPSDKHRLLMSGSFIALVLAMVLLGGTPAALIGVATIVVGHVRFGERRDLFLNNLVAYAWFPLLGGIAFHAAGLDASDPAYYGMVALVFFFALLVNFLVIAGYNSYLDHMALLEK